MKTPLVLVAVASMALAGCASNDSDDTQAGTAPDLTGSSWVLTSYTATGSEQPTPAAASESTLTFLVDGDAAGSTGCNRFGATWTQDGAALTIEPGPVTLMACADPDVEAQEQAVLAAFPLVAAFEQSDDALTLQDAEGADLLTYQAGIDDLAGTSWVATGINNQNGGVEGTAATADVTAAFADDGTVAGFTGCRDYSGQWTAGEGEIAVTDVSTEGDECAGEQATLEENYLAALSNVATFELEGSTLNLRAADGATQVTFAGA
ncbi:MAG: META domain-containing protein [Jiangellales bacterium]